MWKCDEDGGAEDGGDIDGSDIDDGDEDGSSGVGGVRLLMTM